jgi:digeranylgeranylglycerophospholipid reductase
MDFDVVIAGAGPGGCLAARDLARAGLRVGLFERSDGGLLGKTIIVEAEKTVFEQVGLSRPQGDEIPYHAERMRIFSPRRRQAFYLEGEHPAVAIYLDRFVQKLLAEAQSAGAHIFDRHQARALKMEGGRVSGAIFDRDGREVSVQARLVVDATGFQAALVRQLDPELGIGFSERARDRVAAENGFYEIDLARAETAVQEGRHGDEEIWNWLAFNGPYSTHYTYLSRRRQRAYVLIGRKAEYPGPTLPELMDRVAEEQGYFGRKLHGGKGLIRVRRSLDRLAANGFLVIGEAACQVIPAHGSGVASALYAGHLAARAAAEALRDGGIPLAAQLWPYAWRYQQGRGATLAALEVNRLLVESLTTEQITALMESGIMDPEDLFQAAVPRALVLSLRTLPRRMLGLFRNLNLLGAMVRMVRTSVAVRNHYAAYPRRYDPEKILAWEQKTRRLFEPMEQGPAT